MESKVGLSALLFLGILISSSRGQYDPHFAPGRTTMVHLFEWKWNDIALECERFLGPAGFGGVQVSPPTENVVFHTSTIQRPWYERYQPVSYQLSSRSGTEEEFKDMVRRCKAVNVTIYVDAVINHMTSDFPSGTKTTGNSTFDGPTQSYPAVPFTKDDFHGPSSCPTTSQNIENYSNSQQVRNCRLLGMWDIDHSISRVQTTLINFFNKCLKYGVAGFRIDAAKHMWPDHLKQIISKIDNLNPEFGFEKDSRPFIYQEVIDMGGEPITAIEYTGSGRVTEFRFGAKLGRVLRKFDKLKWLNNFGEGWGMLPTDKSLVFIDNHDNQRGHGAGGDVLTFRNSRLYKMATGFMLAWPYGTTRVMSSYFWPQNYVNGKDLNDWIGPPVDANYNTLNVTIKEDFTCANGWICEHRWREIYKMVGFRNAVEDAPMINWWDNGLDQIAFARSGKGFIAINNDDFPLIATLNTSLPAGIYCDVVSGGLLNKTCVGKMITVSEGGMAKLSISNTESDPFVAIHIKEKLVL